MSLGKDPCGAKEKKYTNQTVILISFLISIVSILPMFFFRDKLYVMILSFTLTDCYPWILSGRVLSILQLTEGPDN